MSQYFENDKNIKQNKKLITFYFDDEEYSLYSDNGVFCKDKLDYGTRVLIRNIDIKNLSGKVLDLGCGIGVVGVILGRNNKNIAIDMVDINTNALDLAKKNTAIYGINANVFKSNAYDNVNKKYDYIITNPPIKAGKNVVRRFLRGSFDYLDNHGLLYFVMRKDHGVKSMIKELEENFDVEIIDRDKGFYVLRCKKSNLKKC